MCGRFALDDELNELMVEFALAGHRFPDYRPSWNIAPTQTVPIVIAHEGKSGILERILGPARWSLVPSWSDSLTIPYSTFNARSESVSTTRSFRGALASHRCIVPATGYYEWKTKGKVKTPHFVSHRDGHTLGFAGLYSWWQAADSEQPVATATILTREAPSSLAWLHDRTPVVLGKGTFDSWLDPRTPMSQAQVDHLVEQTTSEVNSLTAYPVGPVRGNGPELILPLGEAEQSSGR